MNNSIHKTLEDFVVLREGYYPHYKTFNLADPQYEYPIIDGIADIGNIELYPFARLTIQVNFPPKKTFGILKVYFHPDEAKMWSSGDLTYNNNFNDLPHLIPNQRQTFYVPAGRKFNLLLKIVPKDHITAENLFLEPGTWNCP